MDRNALQGTLASIARAITAYMFKAKDIAEKKAHFPVVYSSQESARRISEANGQLYDARQLAFDRINAHCDKEITRIEEWAKLDGSQITDDAKLLQGGFELDNRQLDDLVRKYYDNFTMLKLIEQYCTKAGKIITYKGAEERKAAFNYLRESAKRAIVDIDGAYANPNYTAYMLESADLRLRAFTDGTTLNELVGMLSPIDAI